MSIEVVVTFALASPLQYHDPLAHIYDASFGEIPDDKFTFLCLPHLQTPIVPRKSIDTHTISETTCKYRSITAVTHTQMTARHVGLPIPDAGPRSTVLGSYGFMLGITAA